MPESKPFKVGPFKLGMNNRLPDTDLKVSGSGSFIRDAVNIDIDSTGRLSRRDGVTQLISGEACHSLWCGAENELFYVDAGVLNRVVNDSATPIATGLATRRVSYDNVNGVTYWSNGVQSGKVTNGVNAAWSVPLPTQNPSAAPDVGNGTLVPGTYQIYYCFLDASGQESGSSAVCTATVLPAVTGALATDGHRNDDLATAAIVVSGLPVTWPAGVASVALYCTGPDGSHFMKIAEVGLGYTYRIATMPIYGQDGVTLNLTPLPAGDIVRVHNARLLVAAGSVVYVSETYSLGLHDPSAGFRQFDADVTLLVPFQNGGLFVVADMTYWFDGDILVDDAVEVLPYGGIAGSDVLNPSKTSAWWMSPRGIVTGGLDGKATNVQEDNLAISAAGAGATLYRELNGVKQAISSSSGSEVSGAAARSFMTAEVIRKAAP